MSRLVIVSNRVGDIDQSTQTGGLAVAIGDAFRNHGGIWFGCADQGSSGGDSTTGNGKVRCVTVPLSEREYQDYYKGYSNSVLWPLFHYRTDLIEYHEDEYQGYLDVNRRLAGELAPLLKDDDLVWVHDYHLIPFARYLRDACDKPVRIGFFLHIPFPPPEILAASPNHRTLLDALLDYDVVGFQTRTHLANFHRGVERQALGRRDTDDIIHSGGRLTRSGCFPVAIDFEAFQNMGRNDYEDVRIDDMRRQVVKRKRIVGVDRLDYSKGIPARFEAFEKLLENHPELERRVSLLQISPPTREGIEAYDQIRRETEGLAGAINGRFADFSWTPIQYIHRPFERGKLAAILRSSEVGLVTPLHDGMNLVAKEYVAAQDPDDPGVLILSRFAGACEEMPEALIVNPHDTDEMARSLFQALQMPHHERSQRHAALLQRISATSADDWAAAFLAALENSHRRMNPARSAPVKRDAAETMRSTQGDRHAKGQAAPLPHRRHRAEREALMPANDRKKVPVPDGKTENTRPQSEPLAAARPQLQERHASLVREAAARLELLGRTDSEAQRAEICMQLRVLAQALEQLPPGPLSAPAAQIARACVDIVESTLPATAAGKHGTADPAPAHNAPVAPGGLGCMMTLSRKEEKAIGWGSPPDPSE